eukprot:TRINITY_DN1759_c0_g2_i1.p1 TRINITY_DN1759_c0_g2~~TRINITY_DN1759_c0_g2_i1.p1  ORF type:complete len:612 (+),score=202.37 TRINITY_DN1759_c0_g2_i1:17-1852(+)
MASQATFEENRFAHLLQPIRELADNWSIDIAHDLEEYLGELERVAFTFDGGRTNLNFTEAALLIQGSACVYSKKVEYLYNLVHKTLDLIIDKRKQQQQQQASSIDSEGRDRDAFFTDEPDLLPLDHLLKVSDNIDMDDSAPVTKTTSISRVPMALLSTNEDGGEVRRLKDYKVSSSVIHSSGALLLDADIAAQLDDTLQLSVVDLTGTNLNSTSAAAAAAAGVAASVAGDAEMGAGNDSDDDDENAPPPYDAPADDGGWGWEAPPESPSAVPAKQPMKQLKRPAAADPWAMLDAHDSSAETKRPFRKGRTSKAPDTNNVPRVSAATNLLQMIVPPLSAAALRKPFFADFADLYKAQRVNRVVTAQRMAQRAAAATRGGAAPFDEEDDAPEDSDDDVAADWGGDWNNDVPASGAEDMNAGEGAEGMQEGGGLFAGTQQSQMYGTSYEDLCKQYIESTILNAHQYLEDRLIGQRVAEWQDKLTPMLEAESKHRAFDIHQYGDEIIATLPHSTARSKAQVVPFEQVVHDAPQFEVCRMFAAMLQLANQGNIEIQQGRKATDAFKVVLVNPKQTRADAEGVDLHANVTASAAMASQQQHHHPHRQQHPVAVAAVY